MPVSDSEKHGVSILRCRVTDKEAHVPIKKRRFLLKTSSPPSSTSPPQHVIGRTCTEDITDHSRSQDASDKVAAKESVASDISLSQITDNNTDDNDKKSEIASESFRGDEDFSGISILAAAACSSSLGRDCGKAEDRLCVEECSKQDQVREICDNNQESSTPKRNCVKEETTQSSEIMIRETSSCVSTEPVGELLSLSTSLYSSQKVGECSKGATSGDGSLTLQRDVVCSKDEETVGNKSSSSRDDRYHWDLNVSMDAWEQSFEDSDAHNDRSPEKSEDSGKCNGNEKIERLGVFDLIDNQTTTFVEPNSAVLGSSGALTDQTSEANKEKNGLVAYHSVSNPVTSDHNSLSCNFDNDLENNRKCKVEDANCKHHLEPVNNNTEKPVVTDFDNQLRLLQTGTDNEGEDASDKKLKLHGDGNLCRVASEVFRVFSSPPCEIENPSNSCTDSAHDNATADIQTHLCVSPSSNIKREATPYISVSDNVDASLGSDDQTALIEKVESKTNEFVGHVGAVMSIEQSLYDTSGAQVSYATPIKHEGLVTLDSAEVQDGIKDLDAKLVPHYATRSTVREIHSVIKKETCATFISDCCKANMDSNSVRRDEIDTVEDCHHVVGANFSCHPALVVGVSSSSRLREDIDSQYEDGELRETNECAWDGGVIRETECMAGEEDMETCPVSPTRYHTSESEPVDGKKNIMEGVMPISSSVSNVDNVVPAMAADYDGDVGTCDGDNNIKLSHLAEENTNELKFEELLKNGKSSSEMAMGGRDEIGRNDAMSRYGDRLTDSGGVETRMHSKSFRRSLRSQIESPIAHDGSSRHERLDKLESRYEEPSSMRSAERVRYPLNSSVRGRGYGGWNGPVDGRRSFKRHYSPIFRGLLKADGDGVMEREDLRCADSQNDSYAGLHSRCKPERKFSPDRPLNFGRERSFRYGLSVDDRAGRERYNGPSKDEIFQSSLKYRRPLSHRERSLSPLGGRGHSNAYHLRGKSPSRSRSRSPLMWHSQRGRPGAGSGGNTFIRQRSRSPNFRPDVRVQRPRSPLHQPGFAADHAMGFRSFPRNYTSPPRNRWNSARKDDLGHFRDFGCKQRTFALERSPGRNCKRIERIGVTDSVRNIKPDGYYRISEDSAGREFRYEENFEDKRKHYGGFRPTRRSFEDLPSRLHQDASDSFSGNSIRDRDASSFHGRGLRGIDCRIGDPPRLRGEHHSFTYDREGKFNSNSKQFGSDVLDSPSSLQSEEQYQSTRTGRFSVVDGSSRARRYENYEDRRKQYGVVFRHSDMEETEKRVNHIFDRNFQDTPFFPPRRSMRNFDGQHGSLSTRLGEHQNPVVSRQEEKLEDNVQSFGGKNTDDNDSAKG